MTYNKYFSIKYITWKPIVTFRPNGLFHATATAFEMWAIHMELSRPSALQRIINVSINWKKNKRLKRPEHKVTDSWMDEWTHKILTPWDPVGATNWKFCTCTEPCHTSGPHLSYRIKWLQLLSSSPIPCTNTWASTPSLFTIPSRKIQKDA